MISVAALGAGDKLVMESILETKAAILLQFLAGNPFETADLVVGPLPVSQ